MNEVKTITIDVDFSKNKRKLIPQLSLAQIMLHNLKPCFSRISSGKRGLHILIFYVDQELYHDERLQSYRKYCKPLHWSEEIYDDVKRKAIREIRIKYGLTSSVLFDVKSFRDVIRVAGEWQHIQDAWDVELLLSFFMDFWRF